EAGLDALAPGAADILEEAGRDDLARHGQNVVVEIGAEQPDIPVEAALRRASRDRHPAAQPGLEAVRDDLLQPRRVGAEKAVEGAGPGRVGTADLAGGRRPVGLGIAEIA